MTNAERVLFQPQQTLKPELVELVGNRPKLVDSGLGEQEREEVRKKVDSLGKCCEGGSEGWTG